MCLCLEMQQCVLRCKRWLWGSWHFEWKKERSTTLFFSCFEHRMQGTGVYIVDDDNVRVKQSNVEPDK